VVATKAAVTADWLDQRSHAEKALAKAHQYLVLLSQAVLELRCCLKQAWRPQLLY